MTPLSGPGRDSSTSHCTSTARSPSRLAGQTWGIRSRSRHSQSSATGTPPGCGTGGGRSAWGRTWRSRTPAASMSRWGKGGHLASDPKWTSCWRGGAGDRTSGLPHAALPAKGETRLSLVFGISCSLRANRLYLVSCKNIQEFHCHFLFPSPL